jgi:methionyl-tRNA synthetase
MAGKYFLTTAIDYVNSAPHVGTSYEKILADVTARWKRLQGRDVFFLMGNDEHSQQVADRAREQGLSPMAWCDRMEERFRSAWQKLDLSFDRFIRTSQPAHHRACQEIFRRLRAKGDVYKALYQGLYCVGCEERKTESQLQDGNCPNHPSTPLKRMEEENYFFRLSKYADPVRKLISGGGFIEPAFRANEMLQIVDQGLEDISISRRTSRWGVPIPDDPDQVMYVWFDALVNYITAAGFPDDDARFRRLWPADLHVIGKDITRFHAVIWPAMLLSADLEPPRRLAVHGFVYVRQGDQRFKMSKTLGTVIDPVMVADRWGADALRNFLLAEVAFGQDGDFSWDAFFNRANSDLADKLGNLLNRVVAMTGRYQDGTFAGKGAPLPQDAPLRESVGGLADRIEPLMDRMEYHTALAEIWKAVAAANGFIEACAPWSLAKQGRREEVAGVLYRSAEALRVLAVLLSPFIPSTSRRLLAQLGVPDAALTLAAAREAEGIPVGTRVVKGDVLFQKVDPHAEQP